ncbi:MAG: beta-glycosidase [Bacteroidales bacterium]|nr:beta-glycosidase [Bacteroidales bacterium]
MKKLTLFVSILLFISCSHRIESDKLDLSQNEWNLWLDRDAEWVNDSLCLPPVDVSTLPVNKPTIGWEALHRGAGKTVRVPCTVEEHFWGENGHPFGISGNYCGVSWFTTRFRVPVEWHGKRIVLKFESVRLRAEVYLNGKLVGYDIINGTPFEVDLTEHVSRSGENNLDVRITDPNGNFAWRDWELYQWGNTGVAPSHGFGGITGSVILQSTDSVYVSDLFIKNRPDLTSIDLEVSLSNLHEKRVPGEISYRILDKKSGKVLMSGGDHQELFMRDETVYTTLSLPDARLWSPGSPDLYEMVVEWNGADGSHSVLKDDFGFRWFEVRDSEGDKQFFLNDQRVVFRSAISWGHWPVNGIYPTPEMARKQVSAAKSLGLNMLNFHRGIGQTVVLDEADKQGLFYYEEPGGYSPGESEFNKLYKREKLLRMVKRDRNHPSLVIYSMVNEANRDPLPDEIIDMQMAHEMDNTRMITFTSTYFGSGFHGGRCPRGPAAVKLHMLPNDDSLYYFGYWDEHHAGGPGVYMDEFYGGPQNIYRHYDVPEEIVFLGEEGAIGTPPRLALIKAEIEQTGQPGWDGDQYLGQYRAYEAFLDEKGFREAFPTVDALTSSLAGVAYYYQGRIVENFRIGNTGDGYVVNGWEATKIENHSGIVDAFRNLKADPGIIAYYNQPVFVAVKLRNKVIALGDSILSDFYLVNEMNLQGNLFLRILTQDEYGTLGESGYNIMVTGGNRYGELLHEGESLKPDNAGYFTVKAQLYDGDRLLAEGSDTAFVIDYRADEFKVPVAVLDTSGEMEQVLRMSGIEHLVPYGTFSYPKEKVLVVGGTLQPSLITGLSRMNDPLIDWITQGNTLVITRNADVWAEYLAQREVVDYRGKKTLERYWFGGNYFVREHQLFEGLPVNTAFNWEYQCLAGYLNRNRFGMRLYGEECVAGSFADHQQELYTAVGIIQVGEGQIILSSLDLASAIKEGKKSSVTAKQILFNYLKYGLNVDDYFED